MKKDVFMYSLSLNMDIESTDELSTVLQMTSNKDIIIIHDTKLKSGEYIVKERTKYWYYKNTTKESRALSKKISGK